MKKALLLFLVVVGSAQARLGETLAECEKRYGPIVQRVPAKVAASDSEAAIFTKEGITITAETQKGIVWSITYTQSELASETATYLLDVNKPEGGWSAPIIVSGDNYYSSETRTQFAVYKPFASKLKQKGSLTVCSRAYAKANRAFYDEKLLGVRETLIQRTEGSQLKGF
jgi:hypothetical protein